MNKQKILKEFSDFIAIESVSADPGRYTGIEKAVTFLTKKLKSLGFTIDTFQQGKNPPLLVASKIVSKKAKTIGVYGHYDVQPEDPVEEWKTKPFALTVKKGKMWGRGTADNKGHIIQSIAAVEELIEKNELKNNIVFVLEGEEERGSMYLEPYLKKAKKLLSSVDVFYVTDVGMHAKNVPYILYGLRGITYFELEVTIGERDLHSGTYGNRVYNPINVLADFLTKVKDVHTNRILIPGFYDDVRTLAKEELQGMSAIAQTDAEEKKEAQTYGLVGTSDFHPHLLSKILPSFDAHGIVGGYAGEGAKTVIPRTARVKFSFRLVEYQDPDVVEEQVQKFVKKRLPKGVRYSLVSHGKNGAFYTDINNEYVRKTADVLKEVFGHKTLYNRSGGSIPAAEMFQRLYKKPIILTGFTLPDENLHSPNENFDEEMFWKGIEALKKIYGAV